MTRLFIFTSFFVLHLAAFVRSAHSTPQTNASCDPLIEPVNFHEHVKILVGSNRTFSSIIRSDLPLIKEADWTRQYGRSLPHHVIRNTECPTLPNATCSNLTLINVSQSDGSGYYTITAENECGSDNFTVNVEIESCVPNCLKESDIPPLLIPPPPKISAVEGQTITVTATYRGDYKADELQAYWIVDVLKTHKNVFPNTPPEGYNVTVEGCPVANPFCCEFETSIVLESVSLNQSGVKLTSAACRSDDLTHYEQENNTIDVYRHPTIFDSPGNKGSKSISLGDSTQLTCTYNASSDPHIAITKWSVNDTLIAYNTSHYTMSTKYNYDYFNPDQVKSTLLISNMTSDISGKYTCWCEYNKSVVYRNKIFRSDTASVNVTIISGHSHHSVPLLAIVIPTAAVVVSMLVVLLLIFSSYCFYKRKIKHISDDSAMQINSETTPLLSDQTSAPAEQGKPLLNLASDYSINNTRHREGVDTAEIDGEKKLSNTANGGTESVRPGSQSGLIDDQTAADSEEGVTQHHPHQPGSSGAANFESVEEKRKRDGQDSNGPSSQRVAPTTLTLESAKPHLTAPTAKDQTTNETCPPLINRLPTCEPIESNKEAPHSGKPAVATASCERAALVKSLPTRPVKSCGANTQILNHIAVDFTKLINVEALLPYLLAHQMLTNDEVYICHSSPTPTKNATELLRVMKQRGSRALQKLLCCLTKETTHSGHKSVAVKLKDAMEMFNFNGKLVCPVCRKPISNNDKLISGQTSSHYEEGLTPGHQRSLLQPGSHMVTGAGNFQEEEQKKDQQHHPSSNGLSAPQQVSVSTTPSLESTNPQSAVSAPVGKDGRTFVQEETSVNQPSVTENVDHTTKISTELLKRLSTSEPIDSVKEMPITGTPALITQGSQESTTLLECGTPVECDTTSKVLNHIAVEFTKSIYLDALVPRLMAHELLTDAEAFVCQCKLTPPSQKAQELLKFLRHKGNEVLQKLLCCLNKERSHPGHKSVAAKLIEAIKFHKFETEMDCPICKAPIKLSAIYEPEMLDEIFATITSNCPAEKWQELATALELSDSDIEHIKTLAADSKKSFTMVLQRWRQLHAQTTKEELIAKLHNSDLDYVVQ